MNRHHWWEAVERRRLDMHEEALTEPPATLPGPPDAPPPPGKRRCVSCGAVFARAAGAGRPAATCGDADCERDYRNAARREKYAANGPSRPLDGRSRANPYQEASDG